MVAKGRVTGAPSGEGNPKAKLSDYQRAAVPALYEKGWAQERLGAAFGVTQSAISRILKEHREKGTP